jgi:hypothetical protein
MLVAENSYFSVPSKDVGGGKGTENTICVKQSFRLPLTFGNCGPFSIPRTVQSLHSYCTYRTATFSPIQPYHDIMQRLKIVSYSRLPMFLHSDYPTSQLRCANHGTGTAGRNLLLCSISPTMITCIGATLIGNLASSYLSRFVFDSFNYASSLSFARAAAA